MGQAVRDEAQIKRQHRMHSRRPLVWQDDMAEVKETFRRVASAKPSGYSLPNETRAAPTLSRNRRARIRSQVPPKNLHVPAKIMSEIQNNRSQSPFVSLSHLQNVLGMCRRIQSQSSVTERKKNPHDPELYPVFVRRPASVSCFSDINVDSWQQDTGLSNSDRTPLSYTPAPFKPLYDISNRAIPSSGFPRSPFGSSTGSEKHACEKPNWTHYKKVIDHPILGGATKRPLLYFWSWTEENLEKNVFKKSSIKKGSVDSGSMHSSNLSDSWPSSSNLTEDTGSVTTSDLPSVDRLCGFTSASSWPASSWPDPFSPKFLSDRRPHSENDLGMHSSSYLSERPPSRCMKRPFSSCSWRHRGIARLDDLIHCQQNGKMTFSDCSSVSFTSTPDGSFTPRDLEGNILSKSADKKAVPSEKRLKKAFKSDSMQETVSRRDTDKPMVVQKQSASVHNHGKRGWQGDAKFDCRNLGGIPSISWLEELPPRKWAKKLAFESIGRTMLPYSQAKRISSAKLMNEEDCSLAKHRVKFANPADDRMGVETESCRLSRERPTGVLKGERPRTFQKQDSDESNTRNLIENGRAMNSPISNCKDSGEALRESNKSFNDGKLGVNDLEGLCSIIDGKSDEEEEEGLEEQFKNCLDLNPTLRHLYDVMTDLGNALKENA